MGKGEHPNSLANLKPIQKGESRNPDGARRHSKLIRTIKRCVEKDLYDMVQIMRENNFSTFDKILDQAKENPEAEMSFLKVFIGRVALSGARRSDYRALGALFDRILGKPKEHIDLTGRVDPGPKLVIELPQNGYESPSE